MSPGKGFLKRNMNIFQSIINYFKSSAEEAKKVSWPSQKDTVRYSALVVGISVVTALFFAALDTGFSHVVDVSIALKNRTSESAPAAPADSSVQVQPVTPNLEVTPVTTPKP